jgi:GntR family transcriptional repressor for pyruvate dehydrogenase complex
MATLSTGIATHIEQLIVDGGLQPGDRIPPERELAKTLGVSRASLREAMHELESRNLIDRRQGRGTTVASPSAERLSLLDELSKQAVEQLNAAELRDIVEPRIAFLAATRRAATNIRSLDDILRRSVDAPSAEESLRLDIKFHVELAHAAQNPLLSTLVGVTNDWTLETRRHSHDTADARRSSIEGHRRILDALIAGDAEAARLAMESHLADVRRLVADRPIAPDTRSRRRADPESSET